jgi:polar amino acid transport system substrate-binding protein
VYADYYLEKMGTRAEYNIIKGGFSAEDFAVGIRKQDIQLKEKIDEGLRTLVKNGTFARISQKWFGEDVTPDSLK